jgi:hypothetical protein
VSARWHLKPAVAQSNTPRLDRKKIRKAAIDRYGFATVGERFTRWFDQLDTLWGEGWGA